MMTAEHRFPVATAATADAVQAHLATHPDATFDDAITALLAGIEATAACRHCGRGIWYGNDDRWRHDDLAKSRRCRAAMFYDDPDAWHTSTTRTTAAP